MDSILIPTDFSEAAVNATRYVLRFFAGRNATFRFVNTYTPDFVHSRVMALANQGNMDDDQMQRRSEEGLKELIGDLEEQYRDESFRFEHVSSFNLLTQEIRDQLAEKQCTLLVSGTVGSSGLNEVFLGSNTVRILNTALNCPVLVVPKEARFREPGKISFVTDFAWPFTTLQLEHLYGFTRRFSSRLEIMHIGYPEALSSSQDLHKRQLLLEMDRFNPKLVFVRPQTGKTEVIEQYIGQSGTDLLVMVRNEHNPIDSLLREPVVKRVAFHTEIPFLVLPPSSI